MKKSTWISMIELLLREIGSKKEIDKLYLDLLNKHLLSLSREETSVSEIEEIEDPLEKYISLCRLISINPELQEVLINDYVQIKKEVEQEIRSEEEEAYAAGNKVVATELLPERTQELELKANTTAVAAGIRTRTTTRKRHSSSRSRYIRSSKSKRRK